MNAIGAPAPRPCASCPYRRDVPSGIWAATEYSKLAAYDRPTMEQPPGVFLCHQNDSGSSASRVCAGWAGCHDGDELLAVRIGVMDQTLSIETAEAIRDYTSPVPLFGSGNEAAKAGMAEIAQPGPEAEAAIVKITRRRQDLY
ncbi:DUF6283 family protein [Nocardia sp. NBC_01388]|uniref:DUF6283 family protein n=1 Tax=Nocardia sp. NBC_01388 TaxID=2903596 RepID=UPI00324E34B0